MKTNLGITLFVLCGITFSVLTILNLPLKSVPQKQYAFDTGSQLVKVPVASVSALPETLAESISKNGPDKTDQDIIPGNEFARVGVLDYYPGNYHLVYPDGFKIDYSKDRFSAESPQGGKISLTISSGTFTVSKDYGNLPPSQHAMLDAAGRLIEGSFHFISGAGYDSSAAKSRFGK